MSTFFSALGSFRATFGTTLNGQVQSDVFYSKARNYESALEAIARRLRTFRHRCTCTSSTV